MIGAEKKFGPVSRVDTMKNFHRHSFVSIDCEERYRGTLTLARI